MTNNLAHLPSDNKIKLAVLASSQALFLAFHCSSVYIGNTIDSMGEPGPGTRLIKSESIAWTFSDTLLQHFKYM